MHFLTQSFVAIPGDRHTHMLSFETAGGSNNGRHLRAGHSWARPYINPHTSYYLSHSGSQTNSVVDNLIPNTQGHSHFCNSAYLRLERINAVCAQSSPKPPQPGTAGTTFIILQQNVWTGTEGGGSLLLQVRSSCQKGFCQT